jgi:hypothetical protein
LNDLITKAIRLADTYLKSSGGKYGPFIEARSINPQTDKFWEVEFAHYGETGRSETCDPESILLMVDTAEEKVRAI